VVVRACVRERVGVPVHELIHELSRVRRTPGLCGWETNDECTHGRKPDEKVSFLGKFYNDNKEAIAQNREFRAMAAKKREAMNSLSQP